MGNVVKKNNYFKLHYNFKKGKRLEWFYHFNLNSIFICFSHNLELEIEIWKKVYREHN